MNLEQQVEKLDKYFEGKSKVIYFAGAFLAIFYLCYAGIEPLTLQLSDYFKNSLSETEAQIAKTTDPKELEKMIERQSKSLNANKNKIAELEGQKKIYVDNVKSFAGSFFRQDGINTHINEVTNKALNRNIQITKLVNASKPLAPRVLSAMYDVNVSFNAKKFDSVVAYLYDLESTSEISDIAWLDITSSNGGLKGDINILTWGFKNE